MAPAREQNANKRCILRYTNRIGNPINDVYLDILKSKSNSRWPLEGFWGFAVIRPRDVALAVLCVGGWVVDKMQSESGVVVLLGEEERRTEV